MWLDTLISLKKASKKTLKQISDESGVPIGTLNKLFAGQTKAPKLDTIQSVVHALGYTLDDLEDKPTKKSPGTTETAPGEETQQEIIRLAGGLSPEHQDLFLAILRLIAAKNQGLPVADLVSAGEAALKSEPQNPTQ